MQRHHSEICETGMMPYPVAYLLANVCLVADIRILEEPLVVIQTASGIHSGLLQAFGNLIQLLPRNPSDIEQTVAVIVVQQFHDVREILFAGKVEVYFSQVLVRIADGPAYAVYDEAVIVQRQVAEAGHQHADEKKDLMQTK